MSAQTTADIAELVQGELIGAADVPIDGVAELGEAQPGQLTFIGTEAYAERWPQSRASAALVTRGLDVQPGDGRAIIFVENADLAMARVLEQFAPPVPEPDEGVHATAVVDPTATLGRGVRIGPHCRVGARAHIGNGCVLHAGVSVFDDASIGDDCRIWPGVVIRERCVLGDRCIIHSNVVIGSDGFGYRPARGEAGPYLAKVPQIGIVRIGSDVEIGANTAIDRAKFSETVVGDGTKIDNLVQIGHNCRIGRMCAISGGTCIAGSVVIGDGCTLGGLCAIADHHHIGDGVRLAGGSQVMHDVPAGQTWAGSPAREWTTTLRLHAAWQRLPDLARDVKAIKRKLGL